MTKKVLGVGIVGCGLIGQKRSLSLGNVGKLVACADKDINRAISMSNNNNVRVFDNWESILRMPEVDIVIIASFHNSLSKITLAAIEAGKHVLVEKPAAKSSKELENVIYASRKSNSKIHVGFNHRYHRSIRKAKEIIDSGEIGELMFLRARYGHGGRIGYDKEWRAIPKLSGGGELIDQGAHLIDLSRWFFGEFNEVQGFVHTYFWDMPVEDNGFLILKTEKKRAAFLQVSCTEWKNLFSMEIYGKEGKLDLSGLGGSYGIEKITLYKMLPEMGPPETTSWDFPMIDNSWNLEINEFYDDILHDRQPNPGLKDAFEVLKIIEKIYKDSDYDNYS